MRFKALLWIFILFSLVSFVYAHDANTRPIINESFANNDGGNWSLSGCTIDSGGNGLMICGATDTALFVHKLSCMNISSNPNSCTMIFYNITVTMGQVGNSFIRFHEENATTSTGSMWSFRDKSGQPTGSVRIASGGVSAFETNWTSDVTSAVDLEISVLQHNNSINVTHNGTYRGNIPLEGAGTNGTSLVIFPDTGQTIQFTGFAMYNGTELTHSHNITINFFIFDEFNKILLRSNVTVTAIGDNTYNATSDSGNVSLELTEDFEYRIRYSSKLFKKRDFYITPTLDGTSIDLYLLSLTNSTDVTITVQDNSGTKIQDALVQLQKFFVSVNSYVVVAMAKTDEQGEVILDVDFDDAFYKIFVESGDNNVLTIGAKIFQTAITITLNILADPFTKIDIENGVSTSLTYNNVSDTFSYIVNDLGGVSREFKLEVFERNLKGDILRCNNIQTISSGTLLCTVNSTNVTLFARGMIVGFGGESIITDTLGILGGFIKTAKDLFGRTSLFYTMLFAGSVAGLGIANISVAIVMFVLALGGMMIAGFSFINLGVYIVIVILGLLVIWRLKT